MFDRVEIEWSSLFKDEAKIRSFRPRGEINPSAIEPHLEEGYLMILVLRPPVHDFDHAHDLHASREAGYARSQ